MAKSSTERQRDLRKRRAALGIKRVEFYLSRSEIAAVKQFIKTLRNREC